MRQRVMKAEVIAGENGSKEWMMEFGDCQPVFDTEISMRANDHEVGDTVIVYEKLSDDLNPSPSISWGTDCLKYLKKDGK